MPYAAGSDLGGYTILESLGGGAGTPELYIAQKGSVKVFLKDYGNLFKPEKDRCFERYVQYEERLKTTIQTFESKDPRLAGKTAEQKRMLNSLVYRIYDFRHISSSFTDRKGRKREKHSYIQVFEYLSPRLDLRMMLNDKSLTPDKRYLLASICTTALRYLHEARIVHCDLKPENICLFPRGTAYIPKLIDFDKSFFDGDDLSWISPEDVMNGYSLASAGTPGYFSPEQLDGARPTRASDIFSAGLILYEVLSKNGQPYMKFKDDDEKFKQAVLRGTAPKPVLYASCGKPEKDNAIIDILPQCLDPDPAKRPTAEELNNVMIYGSRPGGPVPVSAVKTPESKTAAPVSSRKPASSAATVPPPPVSAPGSAAPAKPAPVSAGGTTLILTAANGMVKQAKCETFFGRNSLSQFGPDIQFLSPVQFKVYPDGTGWYVEHVRGAHNQTMLNGIAVAGRMKLSAGDVISLGNSGKMPITITFA